MDGRILKVDLPFAYGFVVFDFLLTLLEENVSLRAAYIILYMCTQFRNLVRIPN